MGGLFGDLFDVNNDGKVDIFEQALERIVINRVFSDKSDDKKSNDNEWEDENTEELRETENMDDADESDESRDLDEDENEEQEEMDTEDEIFEFDWIKGQNFWDANYMIECAKCGEVVWQRKDFVCTNCKADQKKPIYQLLREIKKCDVTEYEKMNRLSWQYIRDHSEEIVKIVNNHMKKCEVLCKWIKQILSMEEQKCVEGEVYSFTLTTCQKMCQNSAKLFADYSGYKEYVDQGIKVYLTGKLSAEEILDWLLKIDKTYRCVSGFLSVNAMLLMKELDEKVIYQNEEYRKQALKAAQAFNEMWKCTTQRYQEFFASPGKRMIEMSWEHYEEFLKGLTQKEIDTLDESGWKLSLNYLAEKDNEIEYKEKFIQERKQKRDEKREWEQKEADRIYWIEHPKELKAYKKNQVILGKLEKRIAEQEDAIKKVNEKMKELELKRGEIYAREFEIDREVEYLKNRIFGKKKAIQRSNDLTNERNILKEKLKEIKLETEQWESVKTEKNQNKERMQERYRELTVENRSLRNK